MSEGNEVYELVESAASYAGKLYNGLEKVVESLREDRIKEGLSSFAEATEGIDWLIQAVTGLNNVGEEYGGFDTETITGFLGEMLDAAENMDYVLLADLIEYEILVIIDEWGNRLDEILNI